MCFVGGSNFREALAILFTKVNPAKELFKPLWENSRVELTVLEGPS